MEEPHITLSGIEHEHCDDCGEESFTIPNLSGLHKLITKLIVSKPGRLTPSEIRFLRKQPGWSAKDLARKLNVCPETVSRWENGKRLMNEHAEKLLRIWAVQEEPIDDYAEWDAVPEPVECEVRYSGEWKPVPLEACA